MPSVDTLRKSIERTCETEVAKSQEYIDKLLAWRAAHPDLAKMIDRARHAIDDTEELMMQGYVVVEPR